MYLGRPIIIDFNNTKFAKIRSITVVLYGVVKFYKCAVDFCKKFYKYFQGACLGTAYPVYHQLAQQRWPIIPVLN